MSTMQQLVAEQGTQPSIGDVAVGVMRVSKRDGVPTARLMLTAPDGQEAVNLIEGQSIDCLGRGTLTLLGLRLKGDGVPRGAVALGFEPAASGSGADA